jgi:hypothetical protein
MLTFLSVSWFLRREDIVSVASDKFRQTEASLALAWA